MTLRCRLSVAVASLGVLVAGVVAALTLTAPAEAATRTFKPVSAKGSALVFRVDVGEARITSARLVAGGRTHRVSVASVRAAARGKGRLRTRAPRRLVRPLRAGAKRSAVRLVVEYRTTGGDRSAGVSSQGVCNRDLATFGAGNWPGACWRPYADDSPFNQPIADDARVDPRSATYVRSLNEWGPGPSDLETGHADTRKDWQHPTYYSRPSDREFTIHCVGDYGVDCEVEGMKVRIPDRARQAGSFKVGWGGDGHMTVVETHTGWEYDFWNVRHKPLGGGQIDVGWGGRTRIDGDGLGSNATAAFFGNLAGIIRAQEMQAGRIDHALFMVIKCSAEEHVYPAQDHGSLCPDQQGAIPFGTRFQLTLTPAQIDALDVPAWKRTILHAMRRYGMYVGDTGGSPWDLQFESGSTYTSFGEEDPMVGFARDQGIEPYEGVYYFDVKSGVDWSKHLRVIAPCEAERTC